MLTLSIAGDNYLHTAALMRGEIKLENVRLIPTMIRPEQLFERQTQSSEYDISEMSLSGHIMHVARGDTRYLGLPIFPSRMFRHGYIWVRSELPIKSPSDLKGRRIGLPQFHMTAALFVRGMLKEDFGLDVGDIEWVQGGRMVPGRIEREPLALPPEVHLTVERQRSLEELLEARELDGVMGPERPLPNSRVALRTLFRDPRATEYEYFKRTGIYPIMHLVTVRRSIIEENVWLATTLFEAFQEAKRRALEAILGRRSTFIAIPGFRYFADEVVSLFGDDIWPYGIEPNRETLRAALRYSREQHLIDRTLGITDLFK